MRRVKTRDEILESPYVTKTEVQVGKEKTMTNRETFIPAVGDEYINQGDGSIYRCVECLEDSGKAILKNTKSGWTFKAHGLGMYSNGMIDWDFSTGGHFA